jgi:hypothetical protein
VDKTLPTRLITFAGSTVGVEYEGDGAARIVDFLYRSIPPATGPGPTAVTFRLLSDDGSNRLRLHCAERLLYEGDAPAKAADLLLSQSCYQLANHSQGGVLFHAGALALPGMGKGWLLPGGVGAGKTTLIAWLLTKGFGYLTDELAFVPDGAETMQTFARPLNLKRPARVVLRDHFDFERHAGCMLSTSAGDLISPEALQPARLAGAPNATLVSTIIFLRYQAGSDFVWRPLSKAQAGLALMQCLVNARNLPEHGFPQISRLAKTVPAYHMTYANFDQIEAQLDSLFLTGDRN